MSVISAGCVLWLERLQPFFVFLAGASLAYQAWLVRRRPRHRRTWTMLAILSASVATSVVVVVTLAGLWVRYR